MLLETREKKQTTSPLELLKSLLKNYFFAIFLAAISAFFLRIFVVEAFRIPSNFMSPALMQGDLLFINKLSYQSFFGYHPKVSRKDIVVFNFTSDPSKDYIKRVIAIENDKVSIKDGVVYVNGQAEENSGYAVSWDQATEASKNMIELQVPKDQVFVLGDQRGKGQDSRVWGFLPVSNIKGRAFFIWFSRSDEAIRWSRIFMRIR